MAKAILFDVDGTLLDTYDFIVRAYEDVARKKGAPISRTTALMYISLGKTLRETYAALMPEHDLEGLVQAHRDYQSENMHLVQPYPGVVDTLKKLREVGIKLATVTNRLRSSSLATMEHAGIKDYFGALVCADDVLRAKPDPEHAFAALRALDAEAADAILIGDTPVDIMCGKAAHIRTIGVSYGVHNDIASYEPDHIVHKIEDILPLVLE